MKDDRIYLKHILRCVLVHDYLGVDLEVVYRAVEQDVPQLKLACEASLAALEHPE